MKSRTGTKPTATKRKDPINVKEHNKYESIYLLIDKLKKLGASTVNLKEDGIQLSVSFKTEDAVVYQGSVYNPLQSNSAAEAAAKVEQAEDLYLTDPLEFERLEIEALKHNISNHDD